MKAKDFILQLEKDYPVEYALEWDNVGLLIGNKEKEIHKVYIALDVTEEELKQAIEEGADMIITHHPLLIQPIKRITGESFLTRMIIKLLQQDILCYTMHTNYDVLRMGRLASTMLGLQATQPLERLEHRKENVGIGELGMLESPITLQACAQLVKDKFELNEVKIFGDLNQRVHKIAITPGSGKSTIPAAIAKGADVLVTGDIGHHEGLDALEEGLMIIDAGHYGTEYMFIADMKEYLQENFTQIQVGTHPISHPFCII